MTPLSFIWFAYLALWLTGSGGAWRTLRINNTNYNKLADFQCCTHWSSELLILLSGPITVYCQSNILFFPLISFLCWHVYKLTTIDTKQEKGQLDVCCWWFLIRWVSIVFCDVLKQSSIIVLVLKHSHISMSSTSKWVPHCGKGQNCCAENNIFCFAGSVLSTKW